jgi:hypothetical protein
MWARTAGKKDRDIPLDAVREFQFPESTDLDGRVKQKPDASA